MKTFVILTSMMLVTWSSEVDACMTTKPIDYRIFLRSDVLIRAEVENYKVQGDGSGAIIRFRSTKTFRGPRLPDWTVRWIGSLNQVPIEWESSGEVFVALNAEIGRDGVPFIAVNQPLCMEETIIPATLKNARSMGVSK